MISILTGDSNSVIQNKDNVSKVNSAVIECTNVFNVAEGEIVYVGSEGEHGVVNVKCNPSEILRYGNLKELTCNKGYNASIGAQLGVADRTLTFEYCTLWKGESNYAVRVNNITYYKQDPTEVLEGTYTIRKDGAQQEGYVINRNRVSFTDEQKVLFGNNVLEALSDAKSNQKWSTSKSASVLRKLGMRSRSSIQIKKDIEEANNDADIGGG